MTRRWRLSTSSYFRTSLRISKFCASTCDLRGPDGVGDHLRLDRHVVGHVEAAQERVDHVGLEQPHEVVLERQVELRLAGVALTTGSTAQLVVDATGLVALGREHVQSAEADDLDRARRRRPPSASRAPRATRPRSPRASSIGDRPRCDSAASAMNSGLPPRMMSVPRPAMFVATVTAPLRPACATIAASRSWCLALRTSCGTPFCLSSSRQVLGLLDAGRADEDRLALRVPLDDVVDDGVVLGLLGAVDEVGVVDADHVAVRRDRHDAEVVDLVELRGLGHGRAGHAARASCTGGRSSAA